MLYLYEDFIKSIFENKKITYRININDVYYIFDDILMENYEEEIRKIAKDLNRKILRYKINFPEKSDKFYIQKSIIDLLKENKDNKEFQKNILDTYNTIKDYLTEFVLNNVKRNIEMSNEIYKYFFKKYDDSEKALVRTYIELNIFSLIKQNYQTFEYI